MAKRKKKTATPKKASASSKRARSLAAKKGWRTRRARAKLTIIKRKRIIKRAPPKKHKRKRPPSRVEYAVNVNYRIKGQSNAISMQFSVMAPPGLTASEVQDIIIETIANEGESPDGTKVKIIDWKGGRVPHEIPWGRLAILADEPATRFRVSQSRSHR